MVLLGSYVGVAGYRRFRKNERAIRSGGDMHTARSPVLIVIGVGLLPLLAALLVVLT